MMYELLPDGSRDESRQWWVQAETVVGNLWLWKYHNDPEGIGRAARCWHWIKNHLLADVAAGVSQADALSQTASHSGHCPEPAVGRSEESLHGEWFWGTMADGLTPDLESPRAGFWKCPYHNTRMCLEVLKVFR